MITRRSRILSLVLAVVMAAGFIPAHVYADDGRTVLDVSMGDVVIGASGASGGGLAEDETELNDEGYIIEGASTEHTITVNTGTSVSVTLRDADIQITTASTSAMTVSSGTDLKLTLEGDNALKTTVMTGAGISVQGGAKLTLDGDGSLTAQGGSVGAGIGGAGTNSVGSITIDGGTITAMGGLSAAGIGANYQTAANGLGAITINGGYVTASAGTGGLSFPGIGGGNKAPYSSIIITGGTIKATPSKATENAIGDGGSNPEHKGYPIVITGGSITGKVQGTPFSMESDGEEMYPVSLHSDDLADKKITMNTNGHTWSAMAENGYIYTYMPMPEAVLMLTADGSTYIGTKIATTAQCTVEMTKINDAECTCTVLTAKVIFPAQELAINKNSPSAVHELKSYLEPDPDCEYQAHDTATVTYSFVDEVDPSIAEISGNRITVYAAAIGETLKIRSTISNKDTDYVKDEEFEVVQVNRTQLDLINGNIEVLDNTTVKCGSQTYTIDEDEEIYIVQSQPSKSTSNTIKVNSGVTKKITLSNINISSNSYLACPITIEGNVTLNLKGNNSVLTSGDGNAAIAVPSISASLTIEGDGNLTAKGGNRGAAIGGTSDGNTGSITINSGTINASASGGGAAIGSGHVTNNIQHITITINGGRVYATASSSAGIASTGIGGGNDPTVDTTVTINGGYVNCDAGASNAGIKADLNINGGSVQSTGMSVEQKMTNGTPVYLCTLEFDGEIRNQSITYKIGESGEEKTAYTDSDSRLYLYLPEGLQDMNTMYNGEKYSAQPNVTQNGLSSATLSKNVTQSITEFTVPGQISSEIYKEDGKNYIDVVMTPGTNLDGLKPILQIDGGNVYKPDRATNFTNSDTERVKFTITGYANYTTDYFVKITNAPFEDDTPIHLDLSWGNIVFEEDDGEKSVYIQTIKNGAVYSTQIMLSENGCEITGASDVNSIIFRADMTDIPITIKDLTITSAKPFSVEATGAANINVAGSNSFTSSARNAAVQIGGGELTFSGGGALNLTGGAGAPAVEGYSGSANSYGTFKIEGGRYLITGGEGAPAIGAGTGSTSNYRGNVIIDGGSVHVVDGTSQSGAKSVQPVNSKGKNVYPLVITVQNGTVKDRAVEYISNEGSEAKPVMTDSDGKLYIYETGENSETYDITVILDESIGEETVLKKHYGFAEHKSAKTEMTAVMPVVTSLSFTDPQSYKLVDIDFTISGTTYLAGDIVLTGTTGSGETLKTISVTAEKSNPYDGTYTAVLTIPTNTSIENEQVYTFSVSVDGKEQTLDDTYTLTMLKNLQMMSFTVPGQVGVTSIDNEKNEILVYLPYDETNRRFIPSVTHSGVSHKPTALTDFTNPQPVTIYSVNNTTDANKTRVYTVTIKSQDKPTATKIDFEQPADFNARTVDVTVTGTAFENAVNAKSDVNKKIWVVAESNDTFESEEEAEYFEIEPAEVKLENDAWVAHLQVPENVDRTAGKSYTLSVLVGEDKQKLTDNTAEEIILSVPRKPQNITDMSFTIPDDQVGETEYVENGDTTNVNVLIKYDSDITNLTPLIEFPELAYATYVPENQTDFTNPVEYTVTSEEGGTKKYIVTVTKQLTPVVTGLIIKNPATSAGGRFTVTLEGENLANAREIVVSGDSAVTAGAVEYDSGANKFVATLYVESNENTEDEAVHPLTVTVDSVVQNISPVPEMHVPRKDKNAKEIVEFTVISGQTSFDSTPVGDNAGTVQITVPYNTDLRNITPQYLASGVACAPVEAGDAKDFNYPVSYVVTAENGTTRTYVVTVTRDDAPEIESITHSTPQTFADTTVVFDFAGKLLPNLGDAHTYDEIAIVARLQGDPNAVPVTQTSIVESDFGSSKIELELPSNDKDFESKTYKLTVTLNGTEYDLGDDDTITLPRRKTRHFEKFVFPNEQAPTVIDYENNTITITVEYEDDVTSIAPEIEVDGDSFSPTEPQNFREDVSYTVTADDDEPITYKVIMKLLGGPEISSMSISKLQNYEGGVVYVDLKGVFHHKASAKAVAEDGTTVESKIVDFADGQTRLALSMPTNHDIDNEKVYALSVWLDDLKMQLPEDNNKVIVPRKPKPYNDITNVTVPDEQQYGEAVITDKAVTVISKGDITALELIIEHTGADIEPKGPQNFSRGPIVFTVTAENGSKKIYTITVVRRTGGMPITSGGGNSSSPSVKPTPTPTPEPTESPKPQSTSAYIDGYPDGSFHPNGSLTRAEVAKIFTVLSKEYDADSKYASRFSDIREDMWHSNYVGFTYENGIVKGYSEDNTFRPDNSITRAEFAVMAARYANINPAENVAFSDTPDEWNNRYISALYYNGAISGYPDGKFRPNNEITRAEAVKIINSIIKNVPDKEEIDRREPVFFDVKPKYWAYYEIMAAAYNKDI